MEIRILNDVLKNEFILVDIKLCNSDSPIKIKYVHQLQNIYFSLTGIELELPGY